MPDRAVRPPSTRSWDSPADAFVRRMSEPEYLEALKRAESSEFFPSRD